MIQRLAVNLPWFVNGLAAHLTRRWWVYVGFLIALDVTAGRYAIGLNDTPSIPYRVVIIERGAPLTKGDLVAFRWTHAPLGRYRTGDVFVKRLAGWPGDRVTEAGRQFFVNGVAMGKAKERTLAGLTLALGPTGVIPAGHFYAHGDGPDSLDSRYELVSWVPAQDIVGRARGLF